MCLYQVSRDSVEIKAVIHCLRKTPRPYNKENTIIRLQDTEV